MQIPFNKPYLTGKETHYIYQAVNSGKISGDGIFTKKCHTYFEEKFGFKKCLLTTSCTDALEMAAILIGIEPEDEVIAPSFTFVSTVNAFVLRGAKMIFADSEANTPNIDASKIEELISPNTKAIIAVHYAGMACDMDVIMAIAKKHNIYVIEDAAQAIDSYYISSNSIFDIAVNSFQNTKHKTQNSFCRPLGSIGDLATFSFHETKNIISGEGGMLVINNDKFNDRAEIIREKGTNRSSFFRGEVDKYGWVDIGSSFLPSDIIAAFLYAQLENLDDIQAKRKAIWQQYYVGLKPLEDKRLISLPHIPEYATNNGHMFYVVCKSLEQRSALIEHLKNNGVYAVFHYLSLHKSPFYGEQYNGVELINSDNYADCLVRLPLFYELTLENVSKIIEQIHYFYKK